MKTKKDQGKFLKVTCARCGNKQVIYGKSSTNVKCLKCNKLLVSPKGGKIKVKALIDEVLSWI